MGGQDDEGLSSKGLVVIGVHRHAEPFEKAIALADSLDIRFPIAQDNEAGASAKYFDLNNESASYLIDKSGRIHALERGGIKAVKQIEDMLAD